MRCKTQQNRALRVEGVAIPFSEGRNRLCPPFCHPAVFSGLLSASGSGNRSKPLQNDDIQSIFFFLHRTGNKKGAPEKGSFVRIKGLEPPRPEASDPKSDVATNYTISANIRTGTAKAGSKTGFRRCVKCVLSFAKLPEDGRNRAGLSAKITGSVPVLCKDKESKRQAKQIRACPSRLLSVGKDN